MPGWWNGRHGGLKIRCPKKRVGSNPTLGTKLVWEVKMSQKQSVHARTASAIRKELKSNHITYDSVKSKSYAGGSSVSICLTDAAPHICEQAKSIVAKYTYGHFDSMDDLYSNNNFNSNIPQVKYAHVSNFPSKQMQEEISNFIINYYGEKDSNPLKAHQLFSGYIPVFWNKKLEI